MGAVPADGAVGLGTGWRVERRRGSAADHHARPVADHRLVELLEVDAPALVLGSTQVADVDGAVRRGSGGGAVLVTPGGGAWIDVTIGRDDPLWDDDVGRAFHWLGRAWLAAVGRLGVVGAAVHEGPLVETPWSRQVCFAGVGPGEVLVDGRKLVGISQRRTRRGARFQCIVHRRWDPAPLTAALGIDADLTDVATGLDRPPGEVLDALVASLPP